MYCLHHRRCSGVDFGAAVPRIGVSTAENEKDSPGARQASIGAIPKGTRLVYVARRQVHVYGVHAPATLVAQFPGPVECNSVQDSLFFSRRVPEGKQKQFGWEDSQYTGGASDG